MGVANSTSLIPTVRNTEEKHPSYDCTSLNLYSVDQGKSNKDSIDHYLKTVMLVNQVHDAKFKDNITKVLNVTTNRIVNLIPGLAGMIEETPNVSLNTAVIDEQLQMIKRDQILVYIRLISTEIQRLCKIYEVDDFLFLIDDALDIMSYKEWNSTFKGPENQCLADFQNLYEYIIGWLKLVIANQLENINCWLSYEQSTNCIILHVKHTLHYINTEHTFKVYLTPRNMLAISYDK